jgi:pimeloyl-ACP methyl ester carboxylesterase
MIKKILIGIALTLVFGIFILPWLIPVTHAEPVDNPDAPFPESRFIQIYGTQIHYRYWAADTNTTPHKTPVLLVHGFSGSTFGYRYMVPALRKAGHSVVAIDLPAFGYSDRNIVSAQLPDPLLCLYLMLTLEPESPWIVVGHSMGASVVSDLTALYPRKVHARILLDGVPRLRPGNAGTGGLFTTALFRRWANVLGKYYFFKPNRIEALLASAYGPEVKPGAADVNGYLEPLRLPGTAEAILKKFRYAQGMPSIEIPDSIPTLLIWGEQDSWIPISVGKSYHEKNPETQWFSIPGAGHCPMETHPDICNTAILNFIANRKL